MTAPDLTIEGHEALGKLVLAADHLARCSSPLALVAAWIFGRHQRFVHLGYRFRLSVWRGRPYLLTMKGPRP